MMPPTTPALCEVFVLFKPGVALTGDTIARLLGITNRAATDRLCRLAATGTVERVDTGLYRLKAPRQPGVWPQELTTDLWRVPLTRVQILTPRSADVEAAPR
jgi:hypothetical protein